MNLKHHFLLAMPGLAGDYFAGSLTFICEHNEDGAIGFIVNRPNDLSLLEVLSQLGLPTNKKLISVPVFNGGPVATQRTLVLHDGGDVDAAGLGKGLYLSTTPEILKAIAQDQAPDQFLVALGYAGWGAGQLEQEMANNIWLSLPANQAVLFHPVWEEKLDKAAQILGIDLRFMAARPGHA